MRSVTSRNTPLDEPDFETVQRLWDEPTIDPNSLAEPAPAAEPAAQVRDGATPDLSGRIHMQTPAGEVDLIGRAGVLRIEINRGRDAQAADRLLNRVTDASSPLWPLARELSIAVDVAVDGSSVAFYDASSPDLDAPRKGPSHPPRPGTDRRLDADEPYGDWTHLDPTALPAGGEGAAA